MRKLLLYYSLTTTLLLVGLALITTRLHRESSRLRSNQQALLADMTFYRTSLDESAAAVEALTLKCSEYRQLHERDTEHIRRLGIRLRRVESVATHASQSSIEISAPVRDTLLPRPAEPLLAHCDTARHFVWHDAWMKVEGCILGDSVHCHIASCDTLRQIIHRVPRRWLFFRFGTKAIRQEIISSNPHTQIVYSEYIELPRRRTK